MTSAIWQGRMIWTAIAFLVGIVWVETRPELQSVGQAAPLLLIVVLACGYWRPKWLAVLAAGVLWAWWRAELALQAQALSDLNLSDRRIAGVVASIPEAGADRLQFDFTPDSARESGLPRLIRLSWYFDGQDRRSGRPPKVPGLTSMPRAAERWQLVVRLKPPHGFANPGGFDYEGQLFREGIGATGYIRASSDNRLLQKAGFGRPVLQLRASIVERMRRVLGDSMATGLATGLAVGATHAIPSEQWQVFAATGITHLIAISGLHVTMIAALAMLLVRLLWRLPWPGPAPRLCRADVAAAAGAFAATGYALLAGLSIPTQRTLVMFLVALGALWLRRAQPPSQALALALIAVLLLDPHAALSPGFWLSFLAVAAILWAVSGARLEGRILREFLSVQGAVSVALLPATLMIFGSISLVAPLVNLLAIPFFSLVLVPGILSGLGLMAVFPAAGETLLKLTAYSFELFWPFLHWAASLPGAFVHLPAPAPAFSFTLALTAAVLITPLPLRLRALGLLLVLPLSSLAPQPPAEGGLRLTVLDVGQGLAVVVRTHSHVLLYDAGPSFRSGRSTGDMVVLPFLWDAGVRRLDRLVISHSDSDHAGGAEAVERAMGIDKRGRCDRGEKWRWDGVQFEFLHPGRGESWNDNNSSCVLRIEGTGGSVLLMGDLEEKGETHLLSQGGVRETDVVVVPHHGSRSSSSEALVSAVEARYAIVSAGYRNRWNFPHSKVIERWCKSGADVPNTAEWGAVSLDVDPEEGIGGPRAYRLEQRRYWHRTSPWAGRSLCR